MSSFVCSKLGEGDGEEQGETIGNASGDIQLETCGCLALGCPWRPGTAPLQLVLGLPGSLQHLSTPSHPQTQLSLISKPSPAPQMFQTWGWHDAWDQLLPTSRKKSKTLPHQNQPSYMFDSVVSKGHLHHGLFGEPKTITSHPAVGSAGWESSSPPRLRPMANRGEQGLKPPHWGQRCVGRNQHGAWV